MPGIIDQFPNPSQLEKLIAFDPKALGFQPFDLTGLTASLRDIHVDDKLSGLSLPPLPGALSKDGFLQTLNQPLNKLKSLDANSVLGDLTSGSLPVALPVPEFDLNGAIAGITSKLLPGTGPVSAPAFNVAIPGMDFSGMVEPLNRLARAGAATPLRLLHLLLRLADAFVATVTDTDQLLEITIQSLREIYSQQITALQSSLPVYALDQASRSLGEADTPAAFSRRYRLLLDQIETLGAADIDRLKQILSTGRNDLIPTLNAFNRFHGTLAALPANDTAVLQAKLDPVLDLTAADEVFLQQYFDQAAAQAHEVLAAIASPVKQIGDMAEQVSVYLKQAVAQAETTAQTVATQIESNLHKVEELLQRVRTTVEDIEQQIQSFIEKLEIGPLVSKAKAGCQQIGAAVEQFFAQVETLKRKLDEMVKQVEENTDQQLTQAFKDAETRLRELLGQISGVLERPEVKDALEQARQGIDKFKTTLDQASLKPVFDLVIDNTGRLETSVKSLDVARMSTPQKTALKVGVKIIEQVKVDEVIKPELLDAFEQIRAPLAELITLLKEKALEIEKIIDAFNPGTVVNQFIVTAEPYQQLLNLLDEFLPSKLLAPLKDANEALTGVVRQLDPNILIDAVQQLYDQLAGLLEIVNPALLNRLIGDATEVAVSRLGHLRDQELDAVIAEVKKLISLARLLEASGLSEIADADFWTLLQDILGGACLEEIDTAIATVEQQLEALAATLDFGGPQALLAATVTSIEQQLTVSAEFIATRAEELEAHFDREGETLTQLEQRRLALLKKTPVFPEVTALLGELELAPVLQLQTTTTAVVSMAPADLTTALQAINAVLQPKVDTLRGLSAQTFQDSAVLIFRRQLSEPVNHLITAIRTELQPFTDALNNIQGILTTVLELPAQIDAAVAKVLDTGRDGIRQMITAVMTTLQTFQQALLDTLNLSYGRVRAVIDDLSPYWLLNSFAESDFVVADSVPKGMLAIARRIVSGGDSAGLRIAALLQTKLSASQLELLQSESGETSSTLQAGNRSNVLLAVNAALRDRNLCSRENVDVLKAELDSQIKELQSMPQPAPAAVSRIYRCSALRRQLADAWVNYNSGENKNNALIRLNRIILEAAYPADITLSLPSLQPFIVENVAQLYPATTVQRLDTIYVRVVAKIKLLPDQLIRAPLDDEFNKIKGILKQNFDISGIFAVLEIKLEGLDDDLAQGLERLSSVYNNLLQTFDQRLAA